MNANTPQPNHQNPAPKHGTDTPSQEPKHQPNPSHQDGGKKSSDADNQRS